MEDGMTHPCCHTVPPCFIRSIIPMCLFRHMNRHIDHYLSPCATLSYQSHVVDDCVFKYYDISQPNISVSVGVLLTTIPILKIYGFF